MANSRPLKTLVDNMKDKKDAKSDAPLMFEDDEDQPKKKAGGKKRLSVERIYQKKTQLEHILLRPDTYIGSTEAVTQAMWVVEEEGNMVNREITYVPGLFKIFDEILVNAADNKQRDPKMNMIKVTIDPENNTISIWNNGKGIPVVEHQKEKMYVPALIFGHLLTSSNYDDSEKKVTGGRNGYGAKLCNIFSTKFTVTTACKEYKKKFKQTWSNNMTKTTTARITDFDGTDFTEVTFHPDLEKFKMTSLDKDTVALLTRRAYDIAGASWGVKVVLNGKKLPVKDFKSYTDLYLKDKVDEGGNPLKVVHEKINDRWEVCLTMSEKGFQQVSFCNSIATTKGGRHVDYIADQFISKLVETVKKKNKGGMQIKPFQIKTHVWVFVNALIENPTFDSQTKENMTLQAKKFGGMPKLSDKFIKGATNCGIVESITQWMKFKQMSQLDKKCHATKHTKIKGVPKLDDANDAGSRYSMDCTLILTEGDSAKSLAVSGLGVVGRNRYGVFPLKGKLLNVREATHKQIMENAEINNIIKIIGLQYKNKYEEPESLKKLRYGKLMIMADQDQDGSHIKGLVINFIHTNWPNLLKHNFVQEFITPIVKATKGKESLDFFSLPEFEEWKQMSDTHKTWKVKYYKGLGTSTMKEAKEYFSDMRRHRIGFKYEGPQDDAAIELAFAKKKVDDRKEWLTEWLAERKSRRETGLSDIYLYNKDTTRVTFNEFVNKELVLFSNADNNRSIPSMVDGLKPGQRKVMFTAFKRYEKREVKVAQMAGAVAEASAYHHGEMSLMNTIINLAQNYVGSNNINLLQPIGQFGTRLHGGKDAASPRYIFTQLSPLARLLFPSDDDPLLTSLYDDNLRIEPEWYCPIIPMVLVNGSDGIGTGWSTKIFNYNVRDIVTNVRRLLSGDDPLPMQPWYKNFKGTIEELDVNRYVCNGEIAVVDDDTVEITELPIRSWTQVYKENVLENMLHGTDKVPPSITDYKEYHTDTTVKFVVTMNKEKLLKAEETGLHKFFKLQTTLTQHSTMVLFDAGGCIRRYDRVEEILQEFFRLRLDMYQKRKDYMEGLMEAESSKLNNQARFIMEKIQGDVIIENKSKREMIQQLLRRGYDSDPLKAWKTAQDKLAMEEEEDVDDSESMTSSSSDDGPDYNYLLGMQLWCLTKEKKDQLLSQKEAKSKELADLRRKTPNMLWKDDLDKFVEELERVELQEIEDERAIPKAKGAKDSKGGAKRKQKVLTKEETKPSPYARRVQPRIDPALLKKPGGGGGKRGKAAKKTIEGALDFDDAASETASVMSSTVNENSEPKEPMSLAERLANKGKANSVAAAKPKKQTTLKFNKPKAKKSPAKSKKGGKKRNPWSSGSESDASLKSDSDMDMDDDFVIPRDTATRRAAQKETKYSYSSDEIDNEDDKIPTSYKAKAPAPAVYSDSDDDYQVNNDVDKIKDTPTKATSSDTEDPFDSAVRESKKRKMEHVVDDSDKSDSDSATKSKPAEPKKTKQAILDVSDDSYKSDSDSATKSKAAKSKTTKQSTLDFKPKSTAAKKTKTSKAISLDSDSESDFSSKFKSSEKESTALSSDSDKPPPAKKEKKERKKKEPKEKKEKKPAKPKATKSTAAKPKAKPKKKKIAWSDSENESFQINDDSDGDVAPVPAKERPGRARAAASVKYNFGDSDDDSDY
ncbi:DNA topoisomerase 2-alpha-like isoform X2 [Amphiura filiformis]|uniref:DNA topoisomerase 2-alpha-like isoform X2 n=1 Tax=Amphiura filiformis TaxID=82378 RepID=UPI003B223973